MLDFTLFIPDSLMNLGVWDKLHYALEGKN